MANPITITVYPVTDVEKAKTFYTAYLGVEPYADSPYYIGYKVGDREVGLDPHGKEIISYVETEDIQKSLEELQAAGATVHAEPKNVGGGLMIAQVKDADGNVLGLRQASAQA